MSDGNETIRMIKIIDDATIAASGVLTSRAIDSSEFKITGNVTLQVEVTGTGTCKFEYSQSNNYVPVSEGGGGDFVKPVSGFSILTGFTSGSGTDTDGKDLANINMFVSEAFKIICTETGTANSVTVNAWLSMQ